MKITDPRSPEVLAWLAELAPADRLAMMLAMTHVFVWLQRDRAWKAEADALQKTLRLSARAKEDLLVRAAAVGDSLRSSIDGIA